MKKDVLFIVGMPRSGTKLLRDLLNQHSDISIFPFESHFIPYFYRKFNQYGDIKVKDNFTNFYLEFTGTTFYRLLTNKNIFLSCDQWYERLQGSSFKDVLDALFDLYRHITGKQIVGDKTPSYITQVPLLAELYPKANYIHIYRDPRDYALSIEKAWGKNKIRATQRWKDQIQKFQNDIKKTNVRYHQLSYESLLSSPNHMLRIICDFLEIEFQEDMLKLTEPSEYVGDAKGHQSIVSTNFNKWKKQIPQKEIHRMEHIAGKLMHELGYEVQHPMGNQDINMRHMQLYKVYDAFSLIKFHIRKQGGIIPAFQEIRRATIHSALR